ncbi:MAG: hypothetical protein Q4P08_06155 [Eubacteriales bacterium]|nr:hypothetical protein [Eubacteriales bacterium]
MSSQGKADILECADFWQGCLVQSKAGHDRGRIYLVIDYHATEDYIRLILVDGRYRKFLQPKSKNPKQLEFLGRAVNQAELAELREVAESDERDKFVRRLIKSYSERERT